MDAARDRRTHFNVLLDDNNRKPTCRFHLNTSQKHLGLINEDKEEKKVRIERLEEICQYADQIRCQRLFSNSSNEHSWLESFFYNPW